jgi:SPX domain protein involved in polyphosphate accumulation
MAVLAALPPVIERHELKYTIPYSYVEPISKFVAPYCSLDHHTALANDHFYLVNSLYFDTIGLEFLKQRIEGKDGRFNMRVRCYGDQSEPPYFIEIKRKTGVSSMKYRAAAGKDEWPNILTDPTYRVPKSSSSKDKMNKELFLRLATSYAIEPKVFTQYKRRAFFSTVDDYARITMDICMKYRVQSDYNLKPCKNMVSYDNQTIYSTDNVGNESVILELKCNIGRVPLWMLDLITRFNLKQQGFSKYLNSSIVGYLDDGVGYMTGDRIACYHSNGL